MRLIDRIIRKFEEEAIEFASAGMEKEAQESRKLASKYTEMKYNGHTHSIRSEIKENE
jgi:phosphoribosyl-ATP pyrophosphohydrolase|tara:strand:+ start:64 stop:237 length:174 start_codon:yes stop_codon:yes gene_type:complete